MPEIVAAVPFLGDIGGALGSLFGAGDAAAAGVGAADAAAASAFPAVDAATAGGLSTIPAGFGTGAVDAAGLFGGTTGLAGTALAGGTDIGSLAGLGAGLGALGTAADVAGTTGGLTAAGLSGDAAGATFGPAADASLQGSLSSGLTSIPSAPASISDLASAQPFAAGGVSSTASGGLPSNVANANASMPSWASTSGAGPVVPSGSGGAAAIAGPAGVGGVDPTALAASAPSNALDLQSVNGAVPAGSAPAGSGGGISDLISKAAGSITSNPLQAAGVAAGLGGLGYNIYEGQQLTKNQQALAAAAQTQANTGQQAFQAGLPIANANNATGTGLINQGEALQTYLTSGTLPPQYMTQINQAIQSAKTNAISQAASSGQSTDPTKNSVLAAQLAEIDNQTPAMITQVANTLFSAGTSDVNAGSGLTTSSAGSLLGAGQGASGLSDQLYQTLVQNDTTQAANTGKAIASLAAAMNGKTTNTAGNVTTQV